MKQKQPQNSQKIKGFTGVVSLAKWLTLLSCVGMRDIGSKPDLNTAKNALFADITAFPTIFDNFNTTFNRALAALTHSPIKNGANPSSFEFLGNLTSEYYNPIHGSTAHWQFTCTQLPEEQELRREAFLTALAVQGNSNIPDLLEFAGNHWSRFRTSTSGNTKKTAQDNALETVRKVTGSPSTDPFEASLILGHPIFSLRQGPPRWQDVFLMLMLKDINPKQMRLFITREPEYERGLSHAIPTPQTPQNYSPKFVKAWEALPSKYRLKNFHDILEKVIATTSSKDEFAPILIEKFRILLDIAKKHSEKESTLSFQLSQTTKKVHQLLLQAKYQFLPALMEQPLSLLVSIDNLIISKSNAAGISNYN